MDAAASHQPKPSLLRKVTFHDRPLLLLVSNMIDDTMPVNTVLTTEHRHLHFLPPWAWVSEGRVIRWGRQIGTADEIVQSAEYVALTPSEAAIADGMARFHAARGWTQDEDPGIDL